MKTDIDLRKTIFRRILTEGLRHGQRINAVSMAASGWYWYMHAAADDYGNLPGDPFLCRVEAAPRRRTLTDEEVAGWCQELLDARSEAHNRPLLRSYEGADGETYHHIVDFEDIQRAPSGRRARKYPPCPWEGDDGQPKPGDDPGAAPSNPEDTGASQGAQDEASGDRGKPEETGASVPHLDPEPESEPESGSGSRARVRAPSIHPNEDLSAKGGSGGGNGASRVGSKGANGSETQRQLAISSALELIGIAPKVSAQLCRLEGITPEIVQRTKADILAKGGARNVNSVLVSRLRKGRYA